MRFTLKKLVSPLIASMAVSYQGLKLPLLRSNQGLGGSKAYLDSIVHQINANADHFTADARVLDFGCGQGRLLNGLLYCQRPPARYVGVDVDPAAIRWCLRYLSYSKLNTSFHWYNYQNERYNDSGSKDFELCLADSYFDFVFCNSLFSHLNDADTDRVAEVIYNKLKPGGQVYLTAFVEKDVADVSENPAGYMGQSEKDNSPLHRVRYEQDYFFGKMESIGFKLVKFNHRGIERTGQSEIWLAR